MLDVAVLTTTKFAALREGQEGLDMMNRQILQEDTIVTKALEKQGLNVKRIAWDDPEFDWKNGCKSVLWRTPWDYYYRWDEFKPWMDKVTSMGVYMMNSAETLHWNIDKHYLADLANKGVNVCKSHFIEVGALEQKKLSLSEMIEEICSDWSEKEIVVKPVVSGSARHTFCFVRGKTPEGVDEQYAKLNKDEAFIVQPFQKNVPLIGEVSVIVFDGQVTHAVLKKCQEGDFRVQDQFGGTVHDYQIGDEEREFAMQCVKACDELPLVARVDMFKDNEGRWSLAELELVEPELWFRFKPESADIYAAGVVRRLKERETAEDRK